MLSPCSVQKPCLPKRYVHVTISMTCSSVLMGKRVFAQVTKGVETRKSSWVVIMSPKCSYKGLSNWET